MKELRLLISQMYVNGVDKAKSRKAIICLSSIKYILQHKDEFQSQDLDWYKVSSNKTYLKEAMEKLFKNIPLAIFEDYEIKDIFVNIPDEIFEKIVTGLNEIQANATVFEIIEAYRETTSIEVSLEQNITQNSILEVPIRMLDIKEKSSIVDYFNGESGVAVTLNTMFKETKKDVSTIEYYGEELYVDSFIIGQLIGYLIFKDNVKIVNGDSFRQPAFIKDNELKRFDYAISDFGFISRNSCVSNYLKNSLPKLEWNDKILNSYWLSALQVLGSLKANGRGAVLINKGPLFSSAMVDIAVRKFLLSEDVIEAIVKFPPRILTNTNNEAYWIIFNKDKSNERKNMIKFIDISGEAEEIDRRHRAITKRGIRFSVDAYKNINNYGVNEDGEFDFSDRNLVNRDLDIGAIWENNYNLDGFEYFKQKDIYSNIANRNMIELSKVSTIRRGIQLNKNRLDVLNKDENKTHYIISLGNIEAGKIILDEKSKIPVEDRWRDLYEVREGDIIVTTKGSVFKTAIVDSTIKNAIISANLSFIRVNSNKYNPEVLKYYLDSNAGRLLIDSLMKGTTTIRSLSSKDLEGLLIPDVDVDKQRNISETIINSRKDYKESIKKVEEKYNSEQININEMMGI